MVGRANRGEVLTFLVFVFISIFFWVAVTAYEETASSYRVELRIEGQPQDIVFTTRVPEELRVTITDKNLQHTNYSYKRRLRRLTVNFERYADAMGNFRISGAELQSLLRNELVSSSQITSISPSLIDARFSVTQGRRIPVRLNATYLPADNHRSRPAVFEPDTVIINAPSAVLDTLSYVATVRSQHYDITDTLSETLALDLPLGVKATPAHVQVTVPVTQYVEKVFDHLPIHVMGAPDGKRITVFPYQARLTCNVDFGHYRDLNDDDFALSIHYDDITSDTLRLLPLRVEYLGPSDVVTGIAVSPQLVEFVIEE